MSAGRLAVLVALLSILAMGTAEAQMNTSMRPYRGLFGGAEGVSSRSQMLDLTLSAFGGWDQPNSRGPQPVDANDRTIISGPFAGGAGSLVYTHPGENYNFNAFASAFSGYFPDNKQNPWYSSYSGGANAFTGFDLGQKWHVSMGGSAYASSDFRIGFTGAGPGFQPPLAGGNTGFENSLANNPSMAANGSVGMARAFSERSTLSFGYTAHYSHFFASDFSPDSFGQSASIRYNHKVTRYAGYHLGYAYSRSQILDGRSEALQFSSIDAGADYGRALSLTRTTSFSFSTGTALSTSDGTGDSSFFGTTRVFFVGSAALTQQIGRTWTADVNYSRSLNYQDGFSTPWLTDIASAGIAGLITERIDLSATATYQSAAIGLGPRNYSSTYFSTQLRAAITKNLAAFASYYYYVYYFGPAVQIPTGIPRQLDRNGARVGLSAWIPLWASRGTP
jgi:hypothetical protein